MTTTYTQLRSGEWGLRVQGTAKSGQTVTVTKKNGQTKTEKVGKVIWTGNGISLCTIAAAKTTHFHRDYPGKMCPACGSEQLDHTLSCWECGYKGQ